MASNIANMLTSQWL